MSSLDQARLLLQGSFLHTLLFHSRPVYWTTFEVLAANRRQGTAGVLLKNHYWQPTWAQAIQPTATGRLQAKAYRCARSPTGPWAA